MSPPTGRSPRVRPSLEPLTDRVVPAATHLYAVGQDVGGASIVRVYGEDGTLTREFAPFGPGFTGGVRVATGDVTGDGTDDVVVAPGPGGGPEVKVYDGATGAVVRDFFAYDPGFRGGVNVAVGDVNGDGKADVVTGTGVGGGPHVEVFDGATGGLLENFFAYEPSFRGGVNVAAGDVNGDGKADIVTGTGAGGGPRVQVFDGASGAEVDDFFAYDPGVRTGVTVAAGDVTGDGRADIVTGAGFGGGPAVEMFDGATGDPIAGFFAYDPGFRGGVAVGVVRAGGADAILVAPGPSVGGFVELFDGATGALVGAFQPFPDFQGGIATGQGAATPATPFGTTFAGLAPRPPATPPAAPQGPDGGDVTGDHITSGGDVLGGPQVVPPLVPDPSAYVPYDPGTAYTSDPASDTSSNSGESGGSFDPSPCDCGDPGYLDDPGS
jgi:hypothetical protein